MDCGGASSEHPLDLSEDAYRRIKQAIIECWFVPGEEVSQTRLEGFTGLGKAPVRTALARLQQEGLIASLPRRGYKVSRVTVRDIENLYRVRMLLEPEAARLAADQLNDAQRERLAELMKIGFQSGDLDSERKFLRANKEFHLTIAYGSGNARLAKVLEQLLDEGTRVVFLMMGTNDLSQAWCEGHQAIYRALRDRDSQRAFEVSKEEVEVGLRQVTEAIMSSPTIAELNMAPVRRRIVPRGVV